MAGTTKTGTVKASTIGKKGNKKSSSQGGSITLDEAPRVSPKETPRLMKSYKEVMLPKLVKELSLRSVMEVPKLEKIVVSVTLKDAVGNPKVLDSILEEVSLITGQRGRITRAKKSIATFKLRAGMPIGVAVTLRRSRMFEFLDRLIHVALPRVRDFKGLNPKAFDGRGNYSLGLREQIIFPEIDYDRVDKIHGLNITICTSAQNNAHAYSLLGAFGMPFRKGV